jgi:hypothetical protein
VGLSPEDAERLLANVSSDASERSPETGASSLRRVPTPADASTTEEEDVSSTGQPIDHEDEDGHRSWE